MATKTHRYTVTIRWTGNSGRGTASYRDYTRDHEISADGKTAIAGSSDPAFLGDATRWNPEELLLASLSACHKLWYLHLCSSAGVTVLSYEDSANGVMQEDADGSGHFEKVDLHPQITISADSDPAIARQLHSAAHRKCFIANSVNFPVSHEPVINVQGSDGQ